MASRRTTAGGRPRHGSTAALPRSRRDLLRLGGGGAVAGVLLAGEIAAPHAVAAAEVPGIVGSWLVGRTDGGGGLVNAFTISFLSDGIAVAQGIGGGPNPEGKQLGASVANGVWQQTADGTFGFTLVHVRYVAETGQPFSFFKWAGDLTLAPDGDGCDLAFRSNPVDRATLQPEEVRPVIRAKGIRITLDANRE
jgi:hypothetical protein